MRLWSRWRLWGFMVCLASGSSCPQHGRHPLHRQCADLVANDEGMSLLSRRVERLAPRDDRALAVASRRQQPSTQSPPAALVGSAPGPASGRSYLPPVETALAVALVAAVLIAMLHADRTRRSLARGTAPAPLPKDDAQDGFVMLSSPARHIFAELFGTIVATVFGNATVWGSFMTFVATPQEQNKSLGNPNPQVAPMSPLAISAGIALTYTLAQLLADEATLNPVFGTLVVIAGHRSLAVNWFCMAAQLLGTFIGNCVTYCLLEANLEHFSPPGVDHRNLSTTMVFGLMYPPEWISNGGAILASITATAILVVLLVPLVIFKRRGVPVLHPVAAKFAIGCVIFCLSMTLAGANLGAALNPAASLGGALFLSAAGWPSEVWTYHGGYVWLTLWAPFVGLFAGVGIANVFFRVVASEGGAAARGQRPEQAPPTPEATAEKTSDIATLAAGADGLAALLSQAAERLAAPA